MPTLCIAKRNGVVAVVKKEDWDAAKNEYLKNRANGYSVPRPILTFADFDKKPELREIATGSIKDLKEYIALGAFDTEECEELYVPFSRDYHLGSEGESIKNNELTFVTSEDDFEKVFGPLSN